MKRFFFYFCPFVFVTSISAQSVYMHEAQEESGDLDFETFLYSLIIIVPLLIIGLFIKSYQEDRRIKKEQEIKAIQKKKDEEWHIQYEKNKRSFFERMECKNKVNVFGAEAVDLGLPSGILWSIMNVGASKFSEVGSVYGWGIKNEINIGKLSTHKLTYHFEDSELQLTDNKTIKQIWYNYDMGNRGKWFAFLTPSLDNYNELITHCRWEFIDEYGIVGWKVIGKNGNFIFFPIQYEWMRNEDRSWKNLFSMFLISSTPDENEKDVVMTERGLTKKAYFLELTKEKYHMVKRLRLHCGYIRPVSYGPDDIRINTIDEIRRF